MDSLGGGLNSTAQGLRFENNLLYLPSEDFGEGGRNMV